jgi:acyl transferase domain-containing protein
MKLLPIVNCVSFPTEKAAVIGINSFGFGGANGSAVIEEYVPTKQSLYRQPLDVTLSKYP